METNIIAEKNKPVILATVSPAASQAGTTKLCIIAQSPKLTSLFGTAFHQTEQSIGAVGAV